MSRRENRKIRRREEGEVREMGGRVRERKGKRDGESERGWREGKKVGRMERR